MVIYLLQSPDNMQILYVCMLYNQFLFFQQHAVSQPLCVQPSEPSTSTKLPYSSPPLLPCFPTDPTSNPEMCTLKDTQRTPATGTCFVLLFYFVVFVISCTKVFHLQVSIIFRLGKYKFVCVFYSL